MWDIENLPKAKSLWYGGDRHESCHSIQWRYYIPAQSLFFNITYFDNLIYILHNGMAGHQTSSIPSIEKKNRKIEEKRFFFLKFIEIENVPSDPTINFFILQMPLPTYIIFYVHTFMFKHVVLCWCLLFIYKHWKISKYIHLAAMKNDIFHSPFLHYVCHSNVMNIFYVFFHIWLHFFLT